MKKPLFVWAAWLNFVLVSLWVIVTAVIGPFVWLILVNLFVAAAFIFLADWAVDYKQKYERKGKD